MLSLIQSAATIGGRSLWSPAKTSGHCPRPNILVHPEEILRIVLRFDRLEAHVVRPIGALHPLRGLIGAQIVHVHTLPNRRFHLLPEVIYPLHTCSILRSVVPAPQQQKVIFRLPVRKGSCIGCNPGGFTSRELHTEPASPDRLVGAILRQYAQCVLRQLLQEARSPIMLFPRLCPPIHHFLKGRVRHHL